MFTKRVKRLNACANFVKNEGKAWTIKKWKRKGPCTVLPALRANSCTAFDRLMIELLDFHILLPMQVSKAMARTC